MVGVTSRCVLVPSLSFPLLLCPFSPLLPSPLLPSCRLFLFLFLFLSSALVSSPLLYPTPTDSNHSHPLNPAGEHRNTFCRPPLHAGATIKGSCPTSSLPYPPDSLAPRPFTGLLPAFYWPFTGLIPALTGLYGPFTGILPAFTGLLPVFNRPLPVFYRSFTYL